MTKRAFSYRRFSTPKQQWGDSLRRQTELAERYAARHGFELDQRCFEDLGVSAYRGANSAKGMLGCFLGLVEEGEIPKGSYLLVESLDRLSRAAARKALRQLEEICDAGITIVTLTDERRFDSETLDHDPMALLAALFVMVRAHEESAMKSGRLKAAWSAKRKRATEKPLTARVPAWLKLSLDRSSFIVIESRARVVRLIFDLTLNGEGQHSIAARLNRDGVPTFGRAVYWQRSYIKKILENPAVVGTFIPHVVSYDDGKRVRKPVEVVDGYFPAIIERDTFERVQSQKLGSRATRSKSALRNLLAGLARCPKCKSTMTRVDKGPNGGRPYLVCVRAKAGGACDGGYRAVHHEPLEAALLANVGLLTKEVPTARDINETDALQSQLLQLIAASEANAAKIPTPQNQARSRALTTLRTQYEAAIADANARFNVAAGPSLVPRMRNLLEACRADPFDRARVNALLRQLFSSVVIEYDMGLMAFNWHHGGETAILYASAA